MSEQWIVLGLMALAFAAGWLARGAASRDAERAAARRRSLEPAAPSREPEPETEIEREVPEKDHSRDVPGIPDIRAALVRARTAYRAVIAIWNRDAGFPSLLGRHAIEILEDELERIEDMAERFEAEARFGDPRAEALETALNELAVLERHVARYREGRPMTHEVRQALGPHETKLDDALATFGDERASSRADTG